MADPKWPTFVPAAISGQGGAGASRLQPAASALFGLNPWWPPLDIYETADDFLVIVEVGGIPEGSLSVQAEGHTVTVSGERPDPVTELGEPLRSVHHREIDHGMFERKIVLPAALDAARVNAHLSGGVLEIRLPKQVEVPAAPVARKIEVH
jgi:HSP20 family protein